MLRTVLGVEFTEFERDWEHHVRGIYGKNR